MDKFFLKIWINRRVSYFVGILSGVGDIFLPGSVAALGNFLRKVIKKLKLQNNNNNKKRT